MTDKPAFLTISQDGSRYTVTYKAKKNKHARTRITGQLQGYSLDTFKNIAENIPVIDWRNTNFSNAFQFAIKEPKPKVTDWRGQGVTLTQYLKNAVKHGATVTTLKDAKP